MKKNKLTYLYFGGLLCSLIACKKNDRISSEIRESDSNARLSSKTLSSGPHQTSFNKNIENPFFNYVSSLPILNRDTAFSNRYDFLLAEAKIKQGPANRNRVQRTASDFGDYTQEEAVSHNSFPISMVTSGENSLTVRNTPLTWTVAVNILGLWEVKSMETVTYNKQGIFKIVHNYSNITYTIPLSVSYSETGSAKYPIEDSTGPAYKNAAMYITGIATVFGFNVNVENEMHVNHLGGTN